LFSKRYTSGIGWGTETPIEANPALGLRAELGMDAQGNVVVTWLEREAVDTVWGTSYSTAQGWGTAQKIQPDHPYASSEAHLAVDQNGSAVVVWEMSDQIWANTFTPGQGWGTPERIQSVIAAGIYPRVTMHAGGTAVAQWTQNFDGSPSFLPKPWVAHFIPGSGWAPQEMLDVGLQDNQDLWHNLVMAPSGVTTSIWRTLNTGNVWANHYTPGAGSDAAESVDPSGGAGFYLEPPRPRTDLEGHVMLIWYRANQMLWAREDLVDGWSAALDFASGLTEEPAALDLALSGHGTGIAVWTNRLGSPVNRTDCWYTIYGETP
jgi:hypothetical protein